MKIARGNTRKIIVMVGEVQTLIGRAKGDVMNDRDPYAMEKYIKDLEKAFNLCVEITGMYQQIEPQANKAYTRRGAGGSRESINPVAPRG